MTITLLIDLDDTLLGNQIDTFESRVHPGACWHSVASKVEPKAAHPAATGGHQFMLAHQRPDATLQENFDSVFYPVHWNIEG